MVEFTYDLNGGQSIQEGKGCQDKKHNLETLDEEGNVGKDCTWEPESKKDIVEKNL